MAYIEKTAFEARVSNNKNDDLCNITGRYQESSADAICSAGILCVRNGNLPCGGFTGINNENAWYMNAAAASVTASDVMQPILMSGRPSRTAEPATYTLLVQLHLVFQFQQVKTAHLLSLNSMASIDTVLVWAT